jgi:hypothetical protein
MAHNEQPAVTTKRFRTTLVRDGSACFVPIGFDPKPLFGKVRAPVKATLAGYTYRSTIGYTHRREHVEALEGAKRADTRARRLAAIVQAMTASAARASAPGPAKKKR